MAVPGGLPEWSRTFIVVSCSRRLSAAEANTLRYYRMFLGQIWVIKKVQAPHNTFLGS